MLCALLIVSLLFVGSKMTKFFFCLTRMKGTFINDVTQNGRDFLTQIHSAHECDNGVGERAKKPLCNVISWECTYETNITYTRHCSKVLLFGITRLKLSRERIQNHLYVNDTCLGDGLLPVKPINLFFVWAMDLFLSIEKRKL